MAAVDMTKHQDLGGPYNVRGFPTIKIFGADKKKPTDYNGPWRSTCDWEPAWCQRQPTGEVKRSFTHIHPHSLTASCLSMLAAGARTAQGLVDGALSAVQSTVKARLSGRRSGGSSGGGSGGNGGGNAVIDLTEASFNSQVLGSDDIWLVAFVAPWWCVYTLKHTPVKVDIYT